ncbi:hypothetical protein PMAYCL1PPCAC_22139, partial [Pristionchus mayeri]
VDDLLAKVLAAGAGGLYNKVTEQDLVMCCRAVKAVFAEQPSMLEINPPVTVCGDINGNYADVKRIFAEGGSPNETNYLFLGNYINGQRAPMQDLETILILFCYKIKYPENFFMLRGNYENATSNAINGFRDEIRNRYYSNLLWQDFNDVFNWMPQTALIGGRILCMHGGPSPRLKSLDQLRNIPRPQVIPFPSLSRDLVLSDPDAAIKGWQLNPRRGGSSYIFGQDVVIDLCEMLGIDLIIRGNQVVQEGYEYFANNHLVTLWSSLNYRGQFDNNAAIMTVSEDLSVTFKKFMAKARHWNISVFNEKGLLD